MSDSVFKIIHCILDTCARGDVASLIDILTYDGYWIPNLYSDFDECS